MDESQFLVAYNSLNAEQKVAVDTIEGPVMVFAGPGTGKTQILALRIANILRQTDLNPQNILALTFTDSGVFAMRERLLKIIGHAAYYVQIHTFHSFCNKIIQENPLSFQNKRDLKQLGDLERVEIIKAAIKGLELRHLTKLGDQFKYVKSIGKNISDLKRENITPEKFRQLLSDEFAQLESKVLDGTLKEKSLAYKGLLKKIEKNSELCLIYEEFQTQLNKQGYYDFDDMILSVLQKFAEEPMLLAEYQERFQYFLADEYQDTNNSQNAVLFELVSYFDSPNLFVVGDDDQAIYRFQGASTENLLTFKQCFPEAKIVSLVQNYRSNQAILDSAQSVISYNLGRLKSEELPLISANGQQGEKLILKEFLHGELENQFIVEKIQELKENGINLNEIAIIVRDNFDTADIKLALEQANIPVACYSDTNILQKEIVRSVLDFMKLIAEMEGEETLVNALIQPWNKLSSLTFLKICKVRSAKRCGFWDILTTFSNIEEFTEDEKAELADFTENFWLLKRSLSEQSLDHWFKSFVFDGQLLDYIKDKPDYFEQFSYLTSLSNFIESQLHTFPNLSLKQLIKRIELMEEFDIPVKAENWRVSTNMVQLLTAHKSKGLEFDYVFLPKLFDSKWGNKHNTSLLTLPESILTQSSSYSKEPNEEERRLFFVALTRAREQVFLSLSAHYNYLNTDKAKVASMFTAELPTEKLDHQKIDLLNTSELEQEKVLVKVMTGKFTPISHLLAGEKQKAFLRNFLLGFKLSASALKTWQQSKEEFIRNYILRLPQKYSPHFALGTAVHTALENLFLQFKLGNLPSINALLVSFENKLNSEIVDPVDKQMILEEGKMMLSSWLDFYKDDFAQPLYVEYNFAGHNIMLGDVPLTGKIDKVELIDKSRNYVRIIDYKTGKPVSKNEIMGKTQKADDSIYQQLVFYCLLAELDPNFPYQVKEAAIDFIRPREGSGKHAKLFFEITQAEIDDLKAVINEAYKEITNLDFLSELINQS